MSGHTEATTVTIGGSEYDVCEACVVPPGHAVHGALESALGRRLVPGEVQHFVSAVCKSSGSHGGSPKDGA